MIPKKLKVGDKVIFKLVATHIAPDKYSKPGWHKGTVTDTFQSGCLCINNIIVIDNEPSAKVYWGGTVIRYVGG